MAKRPPGYWKKLYREHREQRIREACEWQQRNRPHRKKYMHRYYKENPERFRLTPRLLARKRKRRNSRYRNDPEFRRTILAAAKADRIKYPTRRANQMLREYKAPFKTYEEAVASQGGKCAICRTTNGADIRGYRFHVDHCHETGIYRGMLCSNCNLGLGKFRNHPELFERAAMYLRAQERQSKANKQG